MGTKVCVVTGSTSGIGRAAVTRFAQDGLEVVMVARDKGRGDVAMKEVVAKTGNKSVSLMTADISSLASVRLFAADFQAVHSRLDVLVNDAAVYAPHRQVTAEGFELMFATNYLGPFLLTRSLLPRIRSSSLSRIVNVTAPSGTRPDLSDLQGERKFAGFRNFGASKAADLLFTYALARRLEGQGTTVNAYHPGIVKTNLMNGASAGVRLISAIFGLFSSASPEEAAQGIAGLATSDQFAATNGKLVHGAKVIRAPLIDDKNLQEALWKASSALVGLPEDT